MKLSFATLGCPDWHLDQVAAKAAESGYDGVELRGIAGEHIGPEETPAERARIRELFADKGLEIACIMGYSRFTWDDEAQRRDDVAVAIQLLDVAADVGCPILRVFGGAWDGIERDVALDRVVAGLREVARAAEDRGVTVALETHDDWCKGENLAAAIAGVDSKALGVCWDIANAFFVEPLEETYKSIAGKIVHVHFKDGRRVDNRTQSVLPGTGEVDVRQGLTVLKDDGYTGYLSFEWEKKWEPELADPEIAFPHYIRFTKALMEALGVPRG